MLPYHQRKEDLLLNSHLLAYESLVGTLTKQVLAQQEQLSELRQLLAGQHATSVASTSFTSGTGGGSSPPPLATSTRRGHQPLAISVDSVSPIFPPPVDDEHGAHHGSAVDASGRGYIVIDDATCQKLLRQLEPQIVASIEAHMEAVEQRIAVSLAARIRRITKDHVIASLEREVRRVMRDAVIDANDPQAAPSKPRRGAKKSGPGKSKKVRPTSTTAGLGGAAEAEIDALRSRNATAAETAPVPAKRSEPLGVPQHIPQQRHQQDALLDEMARLRKKLAALEQAAMSRHKLTSSSSSSSRSSSSSSAHSSALAPPAHQGRGRENVIHGQSAADLSIGSTSSLRNVDRDVDELLAKFRLLSHRGGGEGA